MLEPDQNLSQTVAVLMTCYNRRDKTIACLQTLYQQNMAYQVYLVDDGCSDGTVDAVQSAFPEVTIISGDGNLYWAGGMRLAFAEALKVGYPYYLWLNDDTSLEPGALEVLLTTHLQLAEKGYPDAIIVGTVRDPITRKPTYGGRKRSNRWYSHKFEAVAPGVEPQQCDTMQGNIVLIPASVAHKVGNIDSIFIHGLGDLDYGLRAQKLGCSVWVAPGYLGFCSQNSVQGSWVDPKLSVLERLRRVTQAKAFPPQVWTAYIRRHSPLWFVHWFLPYIRAVIGYKNLDASPTFREDVEQEA